jgi:uncharacterized phiE125 gp8 family phage protein
MALLLQHLKDPEEEELVIAAARSGALAWIEKRARKSLSRRPWLARCKPPIERLELPNGPVATVTAFRYYDQANVGQVWPSSSYRVSGDEIVRNGAVSWGTAFGCAPLEIEYVAGYENLGRDAPELQSAALLLAGHFYRNREQNTAIALASMPFGVELLVEAARIPVIA